MYDPQKFREFLQKDPRGQQAVLAAGAQAATAARIEANGANGQGSGVNGMREYLTPGHHSFAPPNSHISSAWLRLRD